MDIFLNNLYFLEIIIKNFLLKTLNLVLNFFFNFIYSNIKDKDKEKYIIIQRFGSLGDIVTSIKSVLMIVERYKNYKIIIFHSKNLYSNFHEMGNIFFNLSNLNEGFLMCDSHKKVFVFIIIKKRIRPV